MRDLERELREAFDVVPDADARARTRARVLAAPSSARPRRTAGKALRRRGLAAPVAAALLAISATGAAAVPVSAHALPGDPLYGVRLATERVRVALAGSPADEAAVRLDIAAARTVDLERAIGMGREQAVAEIARRFFEQVRAASDLSGGVSGDVASKIDALVAAQRAHLARIADRIEEQTGDRAKADEVLRDIRRHDDEAGSTPRGRRPGDRPGRRPAGRDSEDRGGRGDDDGAGPGRDERRGGDGRRPQDAGRDRGRRAPARDRS